MKNNRDPKNIMYVSPFCLSSFAFLLSADGGARSSFGAAAKELENLFYNNTGFLPQHQSHSLSYSCFSLGLDKPRRGMLHIAIKHPARSVHFTARVVDVLTTSDI
jgi:hypothetical protein